MSPFIQGSISIFIISLISLGGALTLLLGRTVLNKLIFLLVSLSAGTLLGGAFLHLIPEALEISTNKEHLFIGVLAGIILFFILEKLICWRHCHITTGPKHPHHLGLMNIIGDLIHNFIDGTIIAASFLANPALGISSTIAIALHEVPQEIGDFGVLIHAGFSPKKALWLNFLTSLTAFLGFWTIFFLFQGSTTITANLLPLAAGGFIYIATADLIPELQKEISFPKSFLQLLGIIAGILLMFLFK
jgi:zinc and cadmium transporter